MGKRLYTEEEHEFMKEYVLGHGYREIQKAFNDKFGWEITLKQIQNYIKNNGLKTGRDGRFKKGNKPLDYTKFQNGHMPHTHKPIGSEMVDSGGYVKIKVEEPNVWKCKHNIIWEKHRGVIPKGSIVVFLDGNKRNFEISNLECITKAEHLYLNRHGMRFSDPELMKTAISIAKVECKISERKKHK